MLIVKDEICPAAITAIPYGSLRSIAYRARKPLLRPCFKMRSIALVASIIYYARHRRCILGAGVGSCAFSERRDFESSDLSMTISNPLSALESNSWITSENPNNSAQAMTPVSQAAKARIKLKSPVNSSTNAPRRIPLTKLATKMIHDKVEISLATVFSLLH